MTAIESVLEQQASAPASSFIGEGGKGPAIDPAELAKGWSSKEVMRGAIAEAVAEGKAREKRKQGIAERVEAVKRAEKPVSPEAIEAYADRLEARRERLEDASSRAAERRDVAHESSRRAVAQIPMGQPILVGHHSEGRHRGALKRSDAAMRRALEEDRKSERLAARARGVGQAGISADDPEAVVKLETQIATLEDELERMAELNKVFRKGSWEAVEQAATAPEWKDIRMKRASMRVDKPYQWEVSNGRANVRRMKERVTKLRLEVTEKAVEESGKGWRICEDVTENRIKIDFDSKPLEPVRKMLKSEGWRWNRRLGAWTRMRNRAGRNSVERVVKALRQPGRRS